MDIETYKEKEIGVTNPTIELKSSSELIDEWLKLRNKINEYDQVINDIFNILENLQHGIYERPELVRGTLEEPYILFSLISAHEAAQYLMDPFDSLSAKLNSIYENIEEFKKNHKEGNKNGK
ncbi:MAG: hypothetical protein ACOCRX_06295 [Candidatus Woesearchaeota archaeon]